MVMPGCQRYVLMFHFGKKTKEEFGLCTGASSQKIQINFYKLYKIECKNLEFLIITIMGAQSVIFTAKT